jgi:hypothetical protein
VDAAIETARRSGLHADIELGFDVDAHPVLGDQRLSSWSRETLSGWVFMFTGVMSWMIGQHEGAAIDHHLLAEKAGSHERGLLRWSAGKASCISQ